MVLVILIVDGVSITFQFYIIHAKDTSPTYRHLVSITFILDVEM